MELIVNRKLIKRKTRIGQLATFVGLATMGAAFFMSFGVTTSLVETEWPMITFMYGVLILSLVSLTVARYHIARWARRPRSDEVIADKLPALDHRHYLLSYLPGVPVDHLLVTPRGLLVIVAKHIHGEIRAHSNHWQRKFSFGQIFGGYSEGSLGNPTHEALRARAAVKAQLAAGLGADAATVPVAAAIIFTDSRANVRVEAPGAVPVVEPDQLQTFVRGLHPESKLTPERLQRIVNLFAPAREEYKETPKPPAKKRRRARAKTQAPATDMNKMGRNRAERRMR